MLSLMRELDDGNIPCAADYDLDLDSFADIVEACQDAGHIKDAAIIRGGLGNGACIVLLEQAVLTVKGMEYLHENAPLMKAYKGLKEIREWLSELLPF